jgi:hypothetical protein
VQVEISARLLRLVSDIAQQQGRAEEEVLEEAVVRYLREMGVEDADIGRELGEIYVEPPLEGPFRSRGAPFLELLSRMRSRFDLDPDEAMQIAVREQHAARQERRERAER